MSTERPVSVITDSGCSFRPESPSVQEKNISVVPLDIKFFENNHWTSYEDNHELPLADFYRKMKTGSRLPQTSGSLTGKLIPLYRSCAMENRPAISIHITAHHSTVHDSAILASQIVREEYPDLMLEIVDSKQVSLAVWFLVEQAADLAAAGYPLEDIKRLTLETIPKIEIFTSLSTFENIVKGGRLPSAANYLSSKLQLRPFAGVVNGEIKFQKVVRTNRHVQHEIVSRVSDSSRDIARLAIVHTNYQDGAEMLRQNLSLVYSGDIPIFDAGPSLAVHTGEKGLGLALQKK